MVKKTEPRESDVTVVDTLLAQIESLQDTNQELIQLVDKLTQERNQLLGEHATEDKIAEQRAYELLAQLVDKVTHQRNAAYRKINAVIKQLVK